MTQSSYWTPERLEWLRRAVVDEKLTATQVAIQYFPSKSRNAIIGAVHRHLKHMGVGFARPPHRPLAEGNHEWRLAKMAGEQYLNKKAKRVRDRRKTSIPFVDPAAVKGETVAEKPPAVSPLPKPFFEPVAEGVTIMDIREGLCRYPLWDSKLRVSALDIGTRRYCGCQTHRGLIYCDRHHRRCNTGSIYVRRALRDGDEGEETRPDRPVHQARPSAARAK